MSKKTNGGLNKGNDSLQGNLSKWVGYPGDGINDASVFHAVKMRDKKYNYLKKSLMRSLK
jgi:hypothetical protein